MDSGRLVSRRIAITPGEPAGIGPDILIQLVQQPQQHRLVAFCDPELLIDRAQRLKLSVQLLGLSDIEDELEGGQDARPIATGEIVVAPVRCAAEVEPGKGDARNGAYVLECLDKAIAACQSRPDKKRQVEALVTGPVNKSLINASCDGAQSSALFTGHTEYLAQRCGVDRVVMMLAVEKPQAFSRPLRVALHSTHLPLVDVAGTINKSALTETVLITQRAMQEQYGIAQPKILVCGLNPHAGENGDLGREELDTINPCMHALRQKGVDVSDAMPADTVFTQRFIEQSDVIIAMYHDQGLAPLKSHGFGAAVNITLGLPIIRTSVDHGTAFDLAGTGKASPSSLQHAIETAVLMASRAGRA